MNNEIPYKCNAKTRNGGNCRRSPSQNGRCRLHGGASLAGTASPRFKHGKYSKYLPENLEERRKGISENDLLNSHKQSLAIIKERENMLFTQLSESKALPNFSKLEKRFKLLEKAIVQGEIKKIKDCFEQCKSLIEAGKIEADTWEEIYDLIEKSRKLVESETKRYKAFNEVLTLEQSSVLVNRVAFIVRRHVTDKQILDAISKDLAAVLQREGLNR